MLRQAIRACYQEEPTPFGKYVLSDPGAYPEPPLSGKITWNVRNPATEPKDEQSRTRVEKARELMERIRKSVEQRKHGKGQSSCTGFEE